MSEKWAAVIGADGYEISTHGRARSVDRVVVHIADARRRHLKGRVLKTQIGKRGYAFVTLGKRIGPVYVHRLVLEAFVGPCPEGMECLHWDGDRSNNYLSNLRWGTRTENMADARRHKTVRHGTAHYRTQLHEVDVRLIRELRGIVPQREWAAALGVSRGAINDILRGKNWRHVH